MKCKIGLASCLYPEHVSDIRVLFERVFGALVVVLSDQDHCIRASEV